MSLAQPAKQAMVVLASGQLWPNIESVVYWHERCGGLTDLFIYYTLDRRRSWEPAQRLTALLKVLYRRKDAYPPAIQIHLPQKPCGMLPHEVCSQIKAWRDQLPDHLLIINCTGGNKLMTPGHWHACTYRGRSLFIANWSANGTKSA